MAELASRTTLHLPVLQRCYSYLHCGSLECLFFSLCVLKVNFRAIRNFLGLLSHWLSHVSQLRKLLS